MLQDDPLGNTINLFINIGSILKVENNYLLSEKGKWFSNRTVN